MYLTARMALAAIFILQHYLLNFLLTFLLSCEALVATPDISRLKIERGAPVQVQGQRSKRPRWIKIAVVVIVIGVGGKNISRAKALEHVFGYTVINDVSARDLQMRHLQWFKGKSLDGFCPMGPCIVTADEFGDPQSKRISLRINGETRQHSTTGDMIFSVDAIIEALSRGMTLEAGDIIATGTPEGVGLGRTPPAYLEDGDVVETEIEGIGTLRNRVAAI